MIALSAVQSSAHTFIHNVILFIDIYDNAWYNQVHWLIGIPLNSCNYTRKNSFVTFVLELLDKFEIILNGEKPKVAESDL